MSLFSDPMFDSRTSLFGVPGDILVLAVAGGLVLAGWILLRRIVSVEREPRSFRATDRLDTTAALTRVVALGCATFVLVLGALLLLR